MSKIDYYNKKHPVLGYILIVFAIADLLEFLSTFDLLTAIVLLITAYVAYNFSFAKRPQIKFNKIIAFFFGLAALSSFAIIVGFSALGILFNLPAFITGAIDLVALVFTAFYAYVAYLLWKNK